MVIITKKSCIKCKMLKELLNSKNIEFDELDYNEQLFPELKSIPTLIIKGIGHMEFDKAWEYINRG